MLMREYGVPFTEVPTNNAQTGDGQRAAGVGPTQRKEQIFFGLSLFPNYYFQVMTACMIEG